MTRILTIRSLILIAVVLLLSSGWCIAQDETLRIRGGKSCWGIYLKSDTWGVQWISVSNGTDSPASILVGYIVDDDKLGKIKYAARADIPIAMRRMVRVVYRTGNLEPKKTSAGKKTDKPQKYIKTEWATVLSDANTFENLGRDVGQRSVLPKNATAVAIVRDRTIPHNTDSFLKTLSLSSRGKMLSIGGKLANFPDRWFGYSLVDIVIIPGFDPDELRAAQMESLLQWVRRGGMLIITGNDKLPELLRGPLGQAAGVVATGTHWVDHFKVEGGKKDANVTLDWPVPMAELCVVDADVLLTVDGLPLLTRRRVGNGWVFTLSTGLTASKPTKNYNIWSHIKNAMRFEAPIDADSFIAPMKEKKVPRIAKKGKRTKGKKRSTPVKAVKTKKQAALSSPAEKVLDNIAGRRGPKKIVPVVILLGMVIFVVVFGSILRLKRRGEWLWVVLVPCVVLASLGMYIYSQSRVEHQRLSHVGLITGISTGQARIQQVFAYNSGDQTIQPSFDSGVMGIIRNMSQSKIKTSQLANVDTTPNGIILPGRDVAQKSDTKFYVDSIAEVGGIESELTFDSRGLTGTLTNRMGEPLKSAVIYVNRHSYAVGNVADGNVNIALGDKQSLGRDEFTSGGVVVDKLRNEFLRNLLSVPDLGREVGTKALLIGYMDGSVINPAPSVDMEYQGWSAVVWPVNIVAPPTGTEVTIPSGFVERVILNSGGLVWNETKQSFQDAQYRESGIVLLVRPPKPIEGLSNPTITVNVHIQASNYKLVVSGAKATRSRQGAGRNATVLSRTEIDTIINPTGKYEFVIPDAERFINADGWYGITLEVKGLQKSKAGTAPGKVGKTKKSKTSRGGWSFRTVDVGLKGNVK